jgi:SAM-dependent methyltransferase
MTGGDVSVSARKRLRRAVARVVPGRLRALLPGFRAPDRAGALRDEIAFWRNYLRTGGARWPEDYRNRMDPGFPIQGHLAPIVAAAPGDEVAILDVGAGPLTKLGKTHPGKRVAITPVDLLAPQYDRLLDELGVTPPVRTIEGDAQSLAERFGPDAFDVVHAQNAIDHTADPLAAIRSMLAVTRPGGAVVLAHYENEGLRQAYSQLHQWNFGCDGGAFVIRDRDGRATDVSRTLAGLAETACARVTVDGAAHVLAVLRKRAPTTPGGR